jgi:Leucine-rich repeat (LRR) protein
MTDKQGKEQQSYKGDASNVDLQDQHHSTGFYHSETKNFDENNEPVNSEKDSTCILSLEERFNENEFSNSFTRLTHIHTLVLIGNGQKVNLSAVPSLLNQIQTCIVVNVQSAPNWNEESNGVYALTNLRHLELINCEMIELHDAISKLTSLQTFLIWNSPTLNRLPFSMSKLSSLRCLSLTATNITVDDAILVVTKLSTLQMLKLSTEGDQTQSEISKFVPLQELDIIGSSITVLPTQIGNLTALQMLDLSSNQLTVLPTQIIHLTALQTLDLSSNQLTVLPTQIGHLIALQQLYLYSNQLTLLPTQIGNLTALQQFDLSNNHLTILPTQIGHLTALQQLNLSYNQLTVLPTQTGNLTALQQFDLSNNQLTVLPTQIGHLTAFQTLDLSYNRLTVLPTQIGHLAALQQLDLYHNQLTVLPTQIGHLTALQQLYLNYNHLTVLPTQIGHLTSLHELYLSNNHRFLFIPSELGMLSSLWVLRFEGTNVTFIPPVPLQQLVPNHSLKFPPSSHTSDDYMEFVEVYNDLY